MPSHATRAWQDHTHQEVGEMTCTEEKESTSTVPFSIWTENEQAGTLIGGACPKEISKGPIHAAKPAGVARGVSSSTKVAMAPTMLLCILCTLCRLSGMGDTSMCHELPMN